MSAFMLYFIYFVAALPKAVFASRIVASPANIAGAKSPIETIIQFYNFALMISGFLAFSVIVFGGVKYMLGAGNPSAQGDAKEWIQGAIWGLVLLFGAYVILYTINPNLVKLKMPELRPVQTQFISQGDNNYANCGLKCGDNEACFIENGKPKCKKIFGGGNSGGGGASGSW